MASGNWSAGCVELDLNRAYSLLFTSMLFSILKKLSLYASGSTFESLVLEQVVIERLMAVVALLLALVLLLVVVWVVVVVVVVWLVTTMAVE